MRALILKADRLRGGRADAKRPEDFDPDALAAGTTIELEHTDDRALAREIAMDHLAEDPHYYRKLKRMEKAQIRIRPHMRGGGLVAGYVQARRAGAPAAHAREPRATDAETVFAQARAEFGETDNPMLAGYLLPDGTWLDFSEGSDTRTADHRQIGGLDAYTAHPIGAFRAMLHFMQQGAVRWMPAEDRMYANASTLAEPTATQYRLMVRAAREREVPLLFEVDDAEGREIGSFEFDRPTVDALQGLFARARRDARMEKAVLYEQETADIHARASTVAFPHRFEAAEWTSKNGHPRCRRCGQEERVDGMCRRERVVLKALKPSITAHGFHVYAPAGIIEKPRGRRDYLVSYLERDPKFKGLPNIAALMTALHGAATAQGATHITAEAENPKIGHLFRLFGGRRTTARKLGAMPGPNPWWELPVGAFRHPTVGGTRSRRVPRALAGWRQRQKAVVLKATATAGVRRPARIRPHTRRGRPVRGYTQGRRGAAVAAAKARASRPLAGPGVSTPRQQVGHVDPARWTTNNSQDLIATEVLPTPEELTGVLWWRHDYPSQCYAMAGRYMIHTAVDGAVLVHGTYQPADSPARYGHGWVELPGDRVFDGNLQRFFPRADFERIYSARPVKRYARASALAMMVKRGNFGPWEAEVFEEAESEDQPHRFHGGNAQQVQAAAEDVKKAAPPSSPWESPPNQPLTPEDEDALREAVQVEKAAPAAEPPTVCLDFDGVVHEYHGWNEGKLGRPMPGIEPFLQALQTQGARVVIYSTRDAADIRRWLAAHRLARYIAGVMNEKPIAQAYLDDRAVTFVPALLKQPERLARRLIEFRSHYGKSLAPARRPVLASVRKALDILEPGRVYRVRTRDGHLVAVRLDADDRLTLVTAGSGVPLTAPIIVLTPLDAAGFHAAVARDLAPP